MSTSISSHTAKPKKAGPVAPDWVTDAVSGLAKIATVEEVAEVLRCSTRTVKRYIAEGRLEGFRLGDSGPARVCVPRASVQSFLERRLMSA